MVNFQLTFRMSQRKSVVNEDNSNECLWNINWTLAEFCPDKLQYLSLCAISWNSGMVNDFKKMWKKQNPDQNEQKGNTLILYWDICVVCPSQSTHYTTQGIGWYTLAASICHVCFDCAKPIVVTEKPVECCRYSFDQVLSEPEFITEIWLILK